MLLNCLIGVYGPAGPLGDRLNGPMLVDVNRFTLEVPFATSTCPTSNDPSTFGVATGSPPIKAEQNNAFVDPWGRRYLYFYSRTATAHGYVLYSCGPDGASSVQPDADGIFPGDAQTSGDNADNLYAGTLL